MIFENPQKRTYMKWHIQDIREGHHLKRGIKLLLPGEVTKHKVVSPGVGASTCIFVWMFSFIITFYFTFFPSFTPRTAEAGLLGRREPTERSKLLTQRAARPTSSGVWIPKRRPFRPLSNIDANQVQHK